jgi:RNA polymerase sigma-70 factor (ECF subfamily)
VLVLHYLADLPVEEIARVLKLPIGTVKGRLFRARAALERELGDAVAPEVRHA